MTQYERIKNRSIEEVATGLDKLAGIVCSNYFCKDCPLNFIGEIISAVKKVSLNGLKVRLEMMIDGITILNNVIVSDFNPVPWLIVLIGFLSLACIIIYMESDEIKKFICFVWCGMFAFALLILVADIRYSKVDAIQCTIEDNVSINEVYDKYDVIDKQGEIWTLREKTEK